MERERRSLCASGVRTKREGTVEGKCQVLVWVGVQKSRMEKGFGMSKVHCNLRPKVLEGLGCSRRRGGSKGKGCTWAYHQAPRDLQCGTVGGAKVRRLR